MGNCGLVFTRPWQCRNSAASLNAPAAWPQQRSKHSQASPVRHPRQCRNSAVPVGTRPRCGCNSAVSTPSGPCWCTRSDKKRENRLLVLDQFGPILNPFWTHFGPILDPFWPHFGPILTPFWPHFGHLGHIFGPILAPFWPHFWTHFGPILAPFLAPFWPPFWTHVKAIVICLRATWLADVFFGSFRP